MKHLLATKTTRISRFVTTALLALSLLFLSLSGAAGQAQTNDGLFSPVVGTTSQKVSDDPTVIRRRKVTVRFDQLDSDRAAMPEQLKLNLFTDAEFSAVLDTVQRNASGTTSWVGHLQGMTHSPVYFVFGDGILVGNVTTPGTHYQVRYAREGVHIISEVDRAAAPPDSEPIPVHLPSADADQLATSDAEDDGSFVDILVVYTPAAREAEGGTDAMEALIDLAVTETNEGYAGSNVTQRMRLVHTEEVAYDAAIYDSREVVYHLKETSDGYIDAVHLMRDEYGADLVMLLVNDFKDGDLVGGRGFLMDKLDPGFEAWAFSTLKQKYATGYYAFAHETGHNMGCAHDRPNAYNAGVFSYSYGYQAPDEAFHTIMSYDCPGRCPVINHWSNPNVSYEGQPTGVDSTAPNSADNHLTLENTASLVANFRPSLAPPVLSSPPESGKLCDAPPQFMWESVRWATTYHIQVDDESGFWSPEIDTTSSEAGYAASSSLGLGTYYWRVRALNDNTQGDWSYPSSFEVIPCDIHVFLPAVLMDFEGITGN